jgi:biopolymer transport protein ExbD
MNNKQNTFIDITLFTVIIFVALSIMFTPSQSNAQLPQLQSNASNAQLVGQQVKQLLQQQQQLLTRLSTQQVVQRQQTLLGTILNGTSYNIHT